MRSKIALFCNVERRGRDRARDVTSIYEVPLALHEQGLDRIVVEHLGLETPAGSCLARMVWSASTTRRRGRIAVCGKYIELVDSYKIVQEALVHGGIANDVGVEHLVDLRATRRGITRGEARRRRRAARASGFGDRGHRGDDRGDPLRSRERDAVLRHLPRHADARSSNSRATCGLEDATRRSSSPMREPGHRADADQIGVTGKGGTMRLGAYPCRLREDARAPDLRRRGE